MGDSNSIHNAKREMKSKNHLGKSAIDSSSTRRGVSVKEATDSYEKWMSNVLM
jgi:hypothetical protein